MRKFMVAGIILFNLLTMMLSGCIFEGDEGEHQYYYEIKITMDKPMNFTIYAPIAHEDGSNEMMDKIVSKLKVKQGSGTSEIIHTEHGPALKIESNGSIHLVSDFDDTGDYHRTYLSMNKGTIIEDIEELWIYCDGDVAGE